MSQPQLVRPVWHEKDAPAREQEPGALEHTRAVLEQFEESLRARAARLAQTAGQGSASSHAASEIHAAADEVARCRIELARMEEELPARGQRAGSGEVALESLRRELVSAGKRTEEVVESVAEAIERIDAERCLLAEHQAEHMESTRELIEKLRGEQADAVTARSAELDRVLSESAQIAESVRVSYAGLGRQVEALQAAAGGFAPTFERAEKRMLERFDEQQAELARQRGWIEQKLEEMRTDLDQNHRSEMSRTRTFVLVLQFAAALLPVAAVAFALFLPSILRWLHLGS